MCCAVTTDSLPVKAIDGYQHVSKPIYGLICSPKGFEMNTMEIEYKLARQECGRLPAGGVRRPGVG